MVGWWAFLVVVCVLVAGGSLACRVAGWLVGLVCGLVLLSVGGLAVLLVGGGLVGLFVGWLVGWSGVAAGIGAWLIMGKLMCNYENN